MNFLKTLLPLVILSALLFVACQPEADRASNQEAGQASIPEANKSLATYAVSGMT